MVVPVRYGANVTAAKPKARTRAGRPGYECDVCGHQPAKWVGRCPECGEWGSVVERAPLPPVIAGAPTAARTPLQPARPIATISAAPARARPTGVGELDRVLGGGLVPGAWCCSPASRGSASPHCCSTWPSSGRPGRWHGPALVVSGEESVSQVRLRAERIGALHEQLYLAAETDLAAVLGHLDAVKPGLLVLDSVQTISAPDVDGVPGGVTQVRAVTAALVAVAKERGIADVLVGHVTKDGQVAGPRVLEHLVDVVLHFEGDKHSSLRMVRGLKNRFGAADEVGCFEMHEGGISSLPDPSGLFLNRHAEPVPGTCVTVAMEGRRALVTEVQALIGAAVPARRGGPCAGWTRRGWRWCWRCCSGAAPDTAARPRGVRGHRGRDPGGGAGRGSGLALAVASGALESRHRRRSGGDRRGGAHRRGAPGGRGAPAAGRGGPARVPSRAGPGRWAGRASAPHRPGSTVREVPDLTAAMQATAVLSSRWGTAHRVAAGFSRRAGS